MVYLLALGINSVSIHHSLLAKYIFQAFFPVRDNNFSEIIKFHRFANVKEISEDEKETRGVLYCCHAFSLSKFYILFTQQHEVWLLLAHCFYKEGFIEP